MDAQNITSVNYTPVKNNLIHLHIYLSETDVATHKPTLSFTDLSTINKIRKVVLRVVKVPTIRNNPVKEWIDKQITVDVVNILKNPRYDAFKIRILSLDKGFLFDTTLSDRVTLHNTWDFSQNVTIDQNTSTQEPQNPPAHLLQIYRDQTLIHKLQMNYFLNNTEWFAYHNATKVIDTLKRLSSRRISFNPKEVPKVFTIDDAMAVKHSGISTTSVILYAIFLGHRFVLQDTDFTSITA